jgi:hypothetical protein
MAGSSNAVIHAPYGRNITPIYVISWKIGKMERATFNKYAVENTSVKSQLLKRYTKGYGSGWNPYSLRGA